MTSGSSAASPSAGSSVRISRPALRTASNGAEADDARKPRRAGAAVCRKGGGILPDLDESLLQHVSSDLGPLHDPQSDAVEPAGLELVEPLQRDLAAASHGFDQDADRG